MYGGVNVCLSLGMLLSENHLRLFFFPYNLVQERSCRLLLPLLLESAMRVRSYVLASHRIASHPAADGSGSLYVPEAAPYNLNAHI